jgi:hypothetical protein
MWNTRGLFNFMANLELRAATKRTKPCVTKLGKLTLKCQFLAVSFRN